MDECQKRIFDKTVHINNFPDLLLNVLGQTMTIFYAFYKMKISVVNCESLLFFENQTIMVFTSAQRNRQ